MGHSGTSLCRAKVISSGIDRVAWETNADGSFLTDMQLRQRIQESVLDGCTCGGVCAAFPGDTIVWRSSNEYGYGSQAVRLEPATEEELEERGWHRKNGFGLGLANYAKKVRQEEHVADDSCTAKKRNVSE